MTDACAIRSSVPIDRLISLESVSSSFSTRRWGRFRGQCRLNRRAMSAAFVSDECDDDQNEGYDQDNALFVFGDLENSEEPLHFFA
jgi:hypothetical protein